MNFFSKFFKNKPKDKNQENEEKEGEFLPKKKAVIEERFILKFIENGGKFLYCENIDEVQKNFELIIQENEWTDEDILIINKEIKSTYKLKTEFKSSLEEAKCFVTDCENLIAGEGSILISSNQIHEKKLDNFPENFIIISDTRKLKNTICHTLFNTAVIHVRKILGQYKMIIQYLKQQINNAVELQACVEYLINLPTNMLELDMKYKEAMIVFNMIDRLNRIQQYAPLFYKQEDSDRSSSSNSSSSSSSSSSSNIHRIEESVSRVSISIYIYMYLR